MSAWQTAVAAAEQDPGQLSAANASWDLGHGYAFADPWFLVALPLALAALWWGRTRQARSAARVNLPQAWSLRRSLRQRLLWLPTLLEGLALVLVVVALARPLRGSVKQEFRSEGVDIVLAVDRSSSMRFEDLERGRTRFDVVREVVGDFASRRMADREGAADFCALLSFARYPDLICPFTLDGNAFAALLADLHLVQHEAEDGTAIGVALAKAVALLDGSQARSRIVVLLTDGENTVFDIQPEDAAQLARTKGVRVYTINASRFVYKQDHFGFLKETNEEPDTKALEAIAELTGGRFYRARDREGLERIYGEIESLERTPRREDRWVENHDLYAQVLLPALVLWLAAWLSLATWARRLP